MSIFCNFFIKFGADLFFSCEFLSLHTFLGKLYGLIKAIFPPIWCIYYFNNFSKQSGIEFIVFMNNSFKIRTPRQNQSWNVSSVIWNKNLTGYFANLSSKNLSSLHSYSCKPQRWLTTFIMFFRQIHVKLITNFFWRSSYFSKQCSITINNYKTEALFTF